MPQVKAEVIKILTQMNAEPQEQILRSMTYSVQKILKRLYRYVTIIDSQLDQVRAPLLPLFCGAGKVANRRSSSASKKKFPLVLSSFLSFPTHSQR